MTFSLFLLSYRDSRYSNKNNIIQGLNNLKEASNYTEAFILERDV